MTFPSSRARARLAASAIVLAIAGCGGSDKGGGEPREAAAAFLQRLSTGDVRGMCRSLSPAGVVELGHDFGGSSCPAAAAAAARHVAASPPLRRAVRGVTILPSLDIPLSPGPYRADASSTALRLVIDDPVLGSRQAFDLALRRYAGRWHVDAGIDALFTLVAPPPLTARAARR